MEEKEVKGERGKMGEMVQMPVSITQDLMVAKEALVMMEEMDQMVLRVGKAAKLRLPFQSKTWIY